MKIALPHAFTTEYRQALTTYLIDDRLLDEEGWRLVFQGIDLLSQAEVTADDEQRTFREVYHGYIDRRLADLYISQLLEIENVQSESPALTAAFARQIGPSLERDGLVRPDAPDSWLLVADCVYWWQSFARGYAFEVEIIRDLEATGIAFQAHDLRSRAERYSPADLVVLDLLGDIKTSTYFLQFQPPGELPNDFYITRLHQKGQSRTMVVFQKPAAWAKIDGETLTGELDNVLALLPHPVQLQQHGITLIVVDYETWKQKILQKQAQEGK